MSGMKHAKSNQIYRQFKYNCWILFIQFAAQNGKLIGAKIDPQMEKWLMYFFCKSFYIGGVSAFFFPPIVSHWKINNIASSVRIRSEQKSDK